jgi:hypothetical protein
MVTDQELHILQHSLGLDRYGKGHTYRNRFVTDENTIDFPHCESLTQLAGDQFHGQLEKQVKIAVMRR